MPRSRAKKPSNSAVAQGKKSTKGQVLQSQPCQGKNCKSTTQPPIQSKTKPQQQQSLSSVAPPESPWGIEKPLLSQIVGRKSSPQTPPKQPLPPPKKSNKQTLCESPHQFPSLPSPSKSLTPSPGRPALVISTRSVPTITTRLSRLRVTSPSFHLPPTPPMDPSELRSMLPREWTCRQSANLSTVHRSTLKSGCSEYLAVSRKFHKTCPHHLITKIERVENPRVWYMYQLKKNEYQAVHKSLCKEVTLYHATAADKLDSILKNNFNWRLFGSNVGHRYGQGVSFSDSATYALSFDGARSMVLMCRVLYARESGGSYESVLPKPGCDTTRGHEGGRVWVKYGDHEFYPEFLIHVNATDT